MTSNHDEEGGAPQPDNKDANVQKVMKQTSKTPAEAGNEPGGVQDDPSPHSEKPHASTQPVPSTAPADPGIARRGG
jgi:hypothetical protein